MTLRQIPWTFVVVLAVAICLTIFFGAWAVSTDVEGRYDELTAAEATAQGEGALPGAASPLDAPATEDDSWMSKGLLFACPFH